MELQGKDTKKNEIMENQNQEAKKHIGETKAVSNHIHDLVHDLSNRIDAVWRYDQYEANSNGEEKEEERQLWSDLKEQELKTVERLKKLLYKALGESIK